MSGELNEVIENEIVSLRGLLSALEKQHKYILDNAVFKMEGVIDEIKKSNIEVAKWEMKRRDITKGEPMSKVVEQFNDKRLGENYRQAKKLVEELKMQKDTNEMLIKQGLSYNMKMLQMMNPDRRAKTYSSYGKMR